MQKVKNEIQYRFEIVRTPVGPLTVIVAPAAGEWQLCAILWAGARLGVRRGRPLRSRGNPLIQETRRQLKEYFAGTRRQFDLRLAPEGTAFQLKAWQALRRIPYGQTISYQEQAQELGDARKARAVGAANGRNPLSIVVPCHRVVGKSGKLTGFAGGLKAKAFLLALEGGKNRLARTHS